MSLEGKAASDSVLRGKIHDLDLLVVNAYDIAVKNGFDGTVEEWLASLKGKDGYTPVKGKDYWTEADKTEIVDETVEKMSEGGVSPDWDENDATKFSHIKNRTHYKEYIGENRTLIPATEIPFSGKGANFEVSESLIEGKAYKVTWNGKEYKVTCYVETVDGLGNVYFLGNGTLFGAATESAEPFCIANYNTIYASVTKETEDVETITLQIDEVAEEIIHKLPGEYLPEGLPYVGYGVVLEESEASEYTHPSFGKMWRIDKAPFVYIGKTYTVVYNGSPFDCVCQAAPAGLSSDPNAMAMGNFAAVGGENTGEPFGMLVSNRYNSIDIIDLAGSSAVKVEIHGDVFNKLDSHFMPDEAAKLFDVPFQLDIDDYSFEASTDVSFNDIVLAARTPNTIVRGVGYQNHSFFGQVYLYFNLVGISGDVAVFSLNYPGTSKTSEWNIFVGNDGNVETSIIYLATDNTNL